MRSTQVLPAFSVLARRQHGTPGKDENSAPQRSKDTGVHIFVHHIRRWWGACLDVDFALVEPSSLDAPRKGVMRVVQRKRERKRRSSSVCVCVKKITNTDRTRLVGRKKSSMMAFTHTSAHGWCCSSSCGAERTCFLRAHTARPWHGAWWLAAMMMVVWRRFESQRVCALAT